MFQLLLVQLWPIADIPVIATMLLHSYWLTIAGRSSIGHDVNQ